MNKILFLSTLALSNLTFAQEVVTPKSVLESALSKNMKMKIAIDTLRSADLLVEQEGVRTPVWSNELNFNNGRNATLSATGVSSSLLNSLYFSSALLHTFSLGTEVSAGVQFGGSHSLLSTVDTLNEVTSYSSEMSISVTQPLLRGAGKSVQDASLMIAKAARTKSDAQKLNSTSLLVKEALSAYWNLWLAKKNHEIELDSSKVIQRGLEDAEVKLEAGTLAPAEIISLRIEEAPMKEDVAEAESALREQSITLSLLMGIAPSTKLKAGELPVETQIPDIEKARTEAKSSSYLIMEAKADIESQKVEQILASNLAEPQLDASAGLSVAGLGLGVGDAFSSMGGLDEYLISVGLTLALPLNNDALDNEAQRKAISLSLAKSQLEQTSREIDSRISVLINTLENNQKRLALAKETSQLAAQNVKAQNDRFEIGRATTLEVIDAIRSQREAEFRAVQIRVSIALAKLELEHEMGILLSRSAK